MRRSLLLFASLISSTLLMSGCGGHSVDLGALMSSKPETPHITLKRVPLKLKFGPVGATIEVDLSELKNIALDAKEILGQIVVASPRASLPSNKGPLLTVINKRNNKFTYFEVSNNVKEVRLKTEKSDSVELIVRNKEPLQIELWVDTDSEVNLAVEFKDSVSRE